MEINSALYCTDGWVWTQVLEGNLPDVAYRWFPYDKAEEGQASGDLVIVVWTDPKEGTRHWISHKDVPDALLVA